MKKLLLTASLTLAGVVAYGQGTINFNNATSVFGATTPGFDTHLIRFGPDAIGFNAALTAGTLVSSNAFGVDLTGLRAQMYYGATTITSVSGLTALTSTPVTFRGSTSASIGSWIGGGVRTLAGYDVGATANAAVLVWDVNQYADGLAALAAYNGGSWKGLFGSSALFTYTVPGAGSQPTAYMLNNLPGFAINAVIPEPATFAIAGLGAAALLIFRRRK